MPRGSRMPMAAPVTEGAPQPPERFTPSLPVDGQELMAAWELPPEAWERTSVKTTRFRPGSQQMELLASQTIADWNLEDLARSYGPGTYRVQAGPGPYRTKNTTITVSREFADQAGFAAAPQNITQPSPHELMAARTFQQATTGAVDPLQMAAMIQTAVDKALERVQPKGDSSLDLILKGFELANSLTTRSMETAKNMLGVSPTLEPSARTWADVALELGPSLLGTLQQAISSNRTAPQAPAPPPHANPAAPTLSTHQEPQPMKQNLPPIHPAAVPLLKIMGNYAPMLINHLSSPASPEDLASQLAGLLGADLDPAVIAAAEQVKVEGPAVLAHAHPQLATDKAAATLIAWAEILRNSQE